MKIRLITLGVFFSKIILKLFLRKTIYIMMIFIISIAVFHRLSKIITIKLMIKIVDLIHLANYNLISENNYIITLWFGDILDSYIKNQSTQMDNIISKKKVINNIKS